MAILATVASADIANPDAPGFGTKVITHSDLTSVGGYWGGSPVFTDDGGNNFTVGIANGGGEQGVYYAFEVPTGSAVSVSAGKWQYSGSDEYWGESLLWSADDLDGPVDGLTGMTDAIQGDDWDTAGAAARWDAYAAGYDYFYHSSPPSDQFEAVWNYAANTQHFRSTGGEGDAGTEENPNPFDASYAGGTDSGFTAWGSSPGAPFSMQDISARTYTGVGSLDRCMIDPAAPASGFPEWMVTQGSGVTTQVVAMIKIGGDSNLLAIQDFTIEIRRSGDANGDGVIDGDDATALADNWLSTDNVGWVEGDFNADGIVDLKDATLLAASWNSGVSQAAVPEPSCLIMFIGSLLLLGIRRCRYS